MFTNDLIFGPMAIYLAPQLAKNALASVLNLTLKCIFLNENVVISIKISLKFIPKGPINNIPPLVQIMAWHRPGDKPLSEPMIIILLMHTVMSLLEAPSLIEAPLSESAHCHGIVAPPQNRSTGRL